MLCNPSELPCNQYECYNPETEICHKIREGRSKCKKDESLCVLGEYARKGECYNESTHACPQTKGEYVWTAKVCVKGEEMCHYECFNPETHDCHGHIICKKGTLLCHGTCYDPKEQQCSKNKLCKIMDKACNGECYPSEIQKSCFRIHYDDSYGGVTESNAVW